MKKGEKIYCYFEILMKNKIPMHYVDITAKAIDGYTGVFTEEHIPKRTNASLSAKINRSKSTTPFISIGDGYYTLKEEYLPK